MTAATIQTATTSDAQPMTGAQVVIQALVEQGVDVIFGYPGGAVLPLYDALFQQDKIRHILVRHEQAAVHAAEGYARSTGKVGVVLVTSGPGATNTVTGLTDALMDSVPLVCLTGQVPTHMIGNDAFQEADTVGITRPCTKHNYLVKRPEDLARVMHEAFHVAALRPARARWSSTCPRTSRWPRRPTSRKDAGPAPHLQPAHASPSPARSSRRSSCWRAPSGRSSTSAAASSTPGPRPARS